MRRPAQTPRCAVCGKSEAYVAHEQGLPPGLPMRGSREDPGFEAHTFEPTRTTTSLEVVRRWNLSVPTILGVALIGALVASLCLLSGPTQAQARRGWEYKRLIVASESTTNNPVAARLVGLPTEQWTKYVGDEKFGEEIPTEDVMNGMGAQGWELVSVVTSSDTLNATWAGRTTKYTYVFKRPK